MPRKSANLRNIKKQAKRLGEQHAGIEEELDALKRLDLENQPSFRRTRRNLFRSFANLAEAKWKIANAEKQKVQSQLTGEFKNHGNTKRCQRLRQRLTRIDQQLANFKFILEDALRSAKELE